MSAGAVLTQPDRPGYDAYRNMAGERGPLAEKFARQIVATVGPYLAALPGAWEVLDVGCGYGHTTIELARACRRVVGLEPAAGLFSAARDLGRAAGAGNVEFRHGGIEDLDEEAAYDLIVLDNVFEHLPDQAGALERLAAALKPGGALYLLMPNKLWPLEVHYHLPFLSYLPLRLANAYLRLTGRGSDYTDASYAPTYWRLKRLLRRRPELRAHFVLPADLSLTTAGNTWHYRLGVAALRRCPWLWAVSKAFLVVAVKA